MRLPRSYILSNVLTVSWLFSTLARAQDEQFAIPSACSSLADGAGSALASVGLDVQVLCNPGGAFLQTLTSLTECFNSNIESATASGDPVQVTSLLEVLSTAQEFCGAADASVQFSLNTISACCSITEPFIRNQLSCSASSIDSAECSRFFASPIVISGTTYTLTPPPAFAPSGATTTQATVTATAVTTSDDLSSNVAATQLSTATPDATSSGGTNTRIIVGAVVGSVLGLLLILAGIGFLAYRRKKGRKTKQANELSSGHLNETPQLHGDAIPYKELSAQEARKELPSEGERRAQLYADYPKELQGRGENNVRTIGGVQEMWTPTSNNGSSTNDPLDRAVNHHINSNSAAWNNSSTATGSS